MDAVIRLDVLTDLIVKIYQDGAKPMTQEEFVRHYTPTFNTISMRVDNQIWVLPLAFHNWLWQQNSEISLNPVFTVKYQTLFSFPPLLTNSIENIPSVLTKHYNLFNTEIEY